MSWIAYLVPFGTAAGGAAAVYGTMVRPRAQAHKRHEAEKEKSAREAKEDIEGITSASGEVLLPRLSTRVKSVENKMAEVTKGQALLAQRMDEANGVGARTEKKVDDLKIALDAEHAAIVKRQNEILKALQEKT